MNLTNASSTEVADPVHTSEILTLSIAFFLIGLIGIFGNVLVIVAIVTDKKMKNSATNLLIMSLCAADLLLMTFTIPEIFMFMFNRGWLLGSFICRSERFILVFAVYISVLTQVELCVERYVAIVHPVQARIFCRKKRIRIVIATTWLCSLVCGLPILLFNKVATFRSRSVPFCVIRFPDDHLRYFIPWKYTESVIFYFIPLIAQLVLYTIICKRLFTSTLMLSGRGRRQSGNCHQRITVKGIEQRGKSDAAKSRKSVVKMLIASVAIYFISYSPHQLMLIYNTVSPQPFHQTWLLHVFVTMMTFVNSASSPILYCIFSQNFRYKFKLLLQCKRPTQLSSGMPHSSMHSYAHNTRSRVVNTRLVYSQCDDVQDSL